MTTHEGYIFFDVSDIAQMIIEQSEIIRNTFTLYEVSNFIELDLGTDFGEWDTFDELNENIENWISIIEKRIVLIDKGYTCIKNTEIAQSIFDDAFVREYIKQKYNSRNNEDIYYKILDVIDIGRNEKEELYLYNSSEIKNILIDYLEGFKIEAIEYFSK